jgi:hypothetical protein
MGGDRHADHPGSENDDISLHSIRLLPRAAAILQTRSR